MSHYVGQLREDWRVSVPALLLPGAGSSLTWFCPPLVVAAVLKRFSEGDRPTVSQLLPYLVAFAAVWYGGELVWRVAIHFMNRTAALGSEKLYRRGLDELYAKDLA